MIAAYVLFLVVSITFFIVTSGVITNGIIRFVISLVIFVVLSTSITVIVVSKGDAPPPGSKIVDIEEMKRIRREMPIDMPADTHSIVVYENNQFKEKKPASEFPETMRFREVRITREDGTVVSTKVPVARIEVLLIGEDGKMTAADKATQIVIQDFAVDGTPLENTKMLKKGANTSPQ
ncbi:MAG: hypothetical protein LBO64_03100 [Desulfovibrio sp.]|jgi:hypothetical protein|nr:hypothetical protein [Desulfovibrio sp.]